jgi:CDP-glucose 4,6-dehydratase
MSNNHSNLSEFYLNKKVFITGHTGFKGTWLSSILVSMGAKVIGYSLEPEVKPNLFEISKIRGKIISHYGDIRDYQKLSTIINQEKPEIVFHLAAQPLVLESYHNPRNTYEINVIGTVNLLDALLQSIQVKSILNITTDKVYKNNEWIWGYRENEELNGYDPYSNSKSCSELVSTTYYNSFFKSKGIPVSTVRSGNVIGGGDFSENRIIPDCFRALINRKVLNVRNPNSSRPYLHVLDSLFAYLIIAKEQYFNNALASAYNCGPNESASITTKDLVTLFSRHFDEFRWQFKQENQNLHEANLLKLDCSKIKNIFGWSPKININRAVELTAEWVKTYLTNSHNVEKLMNEQIITFMNYY